MHICIYLYTFRLGKYCSTACVSAAWAYHAPHCGTMDYTGRTTSQVKAPDTEILAATATLAATIPAAISVLAPDTINLVRGKSQQSTRAVLPSLATTPLPAKTPPRPTSPAPRHASLSRTSHTLVAATNAATATSMDVERERERHREVGRSQSPVASARVVTGTLCIYVYMYICIYMCMYVYVYVYI